jgi:hypothetical protein
MFKGIDKLLVDHHVNFQVLKVFANNRSMLDEPKYKQLRQLGRYSIRFEYCLNFLVSLRTELNLKRKS